MKWSWKLGQVSGIAIYVHATFLLIIGWVILTHFLEGKGLPAALVGVTFMLALFGCVLLHELGHALAAKKFGIKTKDITLLPIGGVARLERMPDAPRQELWVALAGPLVNVAIAVALFIWLQLTSALEPIAQLSVARGSFLERLMIVNIFLVVFNMLPAFPMDGGRVLRAVLATRMNYVQATAIAATIGQGMAFLFGFIGLFSNPFLVFIALFVWMGAAQEASAVQMKNALGDITVSQVMLTDFRTLSPDDYLSRAVDLIISGSQQDFPVVDNGRVVGVLTRSDLITAIAQRGQTAYVADFMQRDFQIVDSMEMLESAFARLQTCECHTLPVLRNQTLVGLVTMDNVGEFLMIQAAMNAARGSQGVSFN